MLEDKRTAFLVLDPKGDLVKAILQGICHFAPEFLARTYYLNPFTDYGFQLNLNMLVRQGGKEESGKCGQGIPLDIWALQLAGLVASVSTGQGAQKHLGAGARQLDVLQHVILGALDCDKPGANILWALDALVIPQGLRRLGGLTNSARAREFLLSAHLSDELRASCASRLRTAFAATEALERIVTCEV